MFLVINKDGLVHNCHTKERYEAFKKAGWKDYKLKSEKTENSKK